MEYLSRRSTPFKMEYRSYGLTKTPDNLIVLRPTPMIEKLTGIQKFEQLPGAGDYDYDFDEESGTSFARISDGFFSERKYRSKYNKFKPSTPSIAKMSPGDNLGTLKRLKILRES